MYKEMNKEIVDVTKKENLTYLEALHALKRGEKIELSLKGKFWHDLESDERIETLLDDDYKFRVKQNKQEEQLKKQVVVNGKKFYAEVNKLQFEQEYYVPSLTSEEYYEDMCWNNDDWDKRYLELGIVFLNKEDAIGYAKACLGLD